MLRALQGDANKLKPPSVGPAKDPTNKDKEYVGLRETLDAILFKNESESRNLREFALKQALAAAEDRHKKALDQWTAAVGSELDVLDEIADSEGRLGLKLASFTVERKKDVPEVQVDWTDSQPLLAWDGPAAQIAFWAWALAALSGLLTAYETRHARGRHWRLLGRAARQAEALGLMALVIVWIVFGGIIGWRLYQTGYAPVGSGAANNARLQAREAWRDEADQLDKEASRLVTSNDERREQTTKERKAVYSTWAAALGLPREGTVEKGEKDAGEQMDRLLLLAHQNDRFSQDTNQSVLRAENIRRELGAAVAARQGEAEAHAATRLNLAIGVVVVAALPLLLVGLVRLFRGWRTARQCPRCLKPGKLTVVTSGAVPVVECAVCRYEFDPQQRHMARLCIPAVGMPGSGKTHWLVEAYSHIGERRRPTPVSLTNPPSLGDAELDAQLAQLREHSKGTGGTIAIEGEFPYPLTLQFLDPGLRSRGVVLNLFDFGGETFGRKINVSSLRQRALLNDGFLLFLDPTEPRHRSLKLMKEFLDEMHKTAGLEGTTLRVPVAVCLSRLDLIPTRTSLRTAAYPWLERVRQTAPLPATLSTLRKRSRLVSKALPRLFPWNVEQMLRENFGRNFLFFPLVPVGLVRSELERASDRDFSGRTPEPFGLVEPILWLLHMHYYRALAEGDGA